MNLEPKDTTGNEVKSEVVRKVWVAPVIEEIEFKDTSFGFNSGFDASGTASN